MHILYTMTYDGMVFSPAHIYICVPFFFLFALNWTLFDVEFTYSNLLTSNCCYTLLFMFAHICTTIGAIWHFPFFFYIVIRFFVLPIFTLIRNTVEEKNEHKGEKWASISQAKFSPKHLHVPKFIVYYF